MPRPPTPRPIGEHLTTLARVIRQIEAVPHATPETRASKAQTIDPKRAKKIKRALSLAMTELQEEMNK